MTLQICARDPAHKPVIWNLFQFYCYDTSVVEHCDVEEYGLYSLSAEYFAQYWDEPGWSAHLLRWQGAIAGFALIEPSDAVPAARELADLFVLQRFRRHGIARQVACHFMAQRSEPWTVTVFHDAPLANRFWDRMFQLPALRPTQQLPDPDGRAATVHLLPPSTD